MEAQVLDGFPVRKNDRVWDVLLDYGIVTDTGADGTIYVRFGKRDMTYMNGGFYGASRQRRLFWHALTAYPAPRPGDDGLAEIAAVNEMTTYLRRWRGVGAAPSGEQP